MQLLSRAELERCAPEYDACVARDSELDRFCSRTDWVLSFHDAFHPTSELALARAGGSFVLLALRRGLLEPLEAMWGFASPLVGDGSPALLAELLRARAESRGREPVYLTGLPLRGARTRAALLALAPDYGLAGVSATQRYTARFDSADAWLAARSPSFRRNLRASARRVAAAGVTCEPLVSPRPEEAAALYARALAVERRSWKSASGNGVDQGPMRDFYACMLPRLAARGALRALFARRDGRDVGYLLGGVEGELFRGLQFSFDDSLRALGLGNVLQLEAITRLAAQGIRSYDLGAQSSYKARWAEPGLATVGVLARPRA
jgi:CelD/BcsL family acetyltransferase involved in cellulose biosynthesis